MRTLMNANSSLFPALPSLIEEFFGRDLLDSTTSNRRWNGVTMPAVNITETDNDFLIEVAAPGMKRDDFHVELDNSVLRISSHLEEEKEQQQNNFTRREFNYRSFERNFSLPENKVEAEKISARYADGILYVTVPKKEEAKVKPARQIEIA